MYKIYVIKNKLTDDIIYVGQTKRSLKIRFRGHVRQKHSAIYDVLQNNENDYMIIPIDHAQTKQESFLKEEFWTKFFLQFYQLKNKSIGSHLSQEVIQKLKQANTNRIVSNETRKKLSEANKGKKRSQEYIEKMKKRLSGGNSVNAKKVLCIETGEVFDTITEASKKYHCGSHISCVCYGKRQTAGKLNDIPLHWKFVEE